MGIREDILTALGTRLATITNANSYTTDVKNVFFDEIPMGIDLQQHQVPAIFILDRADNFRMIHKVIEGSWEFDLQLWHNRVSDNTMNRFSGDVFKAIFANSATALVQDQFRLTDRVFEIVPLNIASDLNMIEANRITEISFTLKYRGKPFEL